MFLFDEEMADSKPVPHISKEVLERQEKLERKLRPKVDRCETMQIKAQASHEERYNVVVEGEMQGVETRHLNDVQGLQ